MNTTTTELAEIYMRVLDPKKIKKLMVIQDVSRRELAAAAGWKSHGLLNRILAGEVTTLTPDRAARIARHLGVGLDDLFVARLSTDAGPTGKGRAA